MVRMSKATARAFKLVAPTLSENDVEAQIRSYLEYLGWVVVRNHVGTFIPWRVGKMLMEAVDALLAGRPVTIDKLKIAFQRNTVQLHPAGTADWLAVHTHYPAIWFEVKAPGRKPTAEQLEWLFYMVEKRGFLGGWFDSIEDFKTWYLEHVIERACPS